MALVCADVAFTFHLKQNYSQFHVKKKKEEAIQYEETPCVISFYKEE